ncbi:armadillo repeat-containing protein 6 isoform X6 [Oenanthe melanoleuca]|uniref:armadillo repeat-containing protein 6 isoform X6 n=1 Tax=Oenanthe melanoleuca TaxID=2939378 RepID=UPI0024C2043F|nr:armadillo repeat-containing protein 6 isoform X6 [Oenanthe melanoleuca]
MRRGRGTRVRWPSGAVPRSPFVRRRRRPAGAQDTAGDPSHPRKMGSKQIAQETFDDAVQENITEFEMDPEEAVREAVQQFESQGVDLSNIVKAVRPPASENGQRQKHQILLTLESLSRAVAGPDEAEVPRQLSALAAQCREQLAFRYLAGRNGAYPVLLSACQLAAGDRDLLLQALSTLAALLDGQPDLLDAAGQQLLLRELRERREDAEMTLAGIRCVRHACLKHEQNRQDFVKGGILPLLTGAITQHGHSAEVVRAAASALRIMTFDDDIRVPFGHAHDHAKMIVLENDGLRVLIEAAKAFRDNSGVLSELCATLSRLSVRNEFCQEIVDLGGLDFMVTLLADCMEHPDVVKQVLSAIRAVAGNDDVKDAIVGAGATELIVLAISHHLGNPQICEQGCAALCVLALRKPENCSVIMEGGGALAALQAMKAHPREVAVQKQACMLIRNLVSRSRDLSQPILAMGAEPLISEARAAHRDCDDVARAALRDLGCKVELRELWTGQKGSLAQ